MSDQLLKTIPPLNHGGLTLNRVLSIIIRCPRHSHINHLSDLYNGQLQGTFIMENSQVRLMKQAEIRLKIPQGILRCGKIHNSLNYLTFSLLLNFSSYEDSALKHKRKTYLIIQFGRRLQTLEMCYFHIFHYRCKFNPREETPFCSLMGQKQKEIDAHELKPIENG